MKGGARVWLIVGTLAILHLVLHVAFGLGVEAPDLLVVALLLGARELGVRGGAALGLCLGLLEDAFSVLSFGANALAMAVVGTFAGSTRDLFVGDSRVFLVSYLFLGKWFRDLVFWMASGDQVREAFADAMLSRAPLTAAYAMAAGVVAFALAGRHGEDER